MYTGDRFRSCDLWIISHNHPLDEPRVVESKGTMFYSALPLSYTGKTSALIKVEQTIVPATGFDPVTSPL